MEGKSKRVYLLVRQPRATSGQQQSCNSSHAHKIRVFTVRVDVDVNNGHHSPATEGVRTGQC